MQDGRNSPVTTIGLDSQPWTRGWATTLIFIETRVMCITDRKENEEWNCYHFFQLFVQHLSEKNILKYSNQFNICQSHDICCKSAPNRKLKQWAAINRKTTIFVVMQNDDVFNNNVLLSNNVAALPTPQTQQVLRPANQLRFSLLHEGKSIFFLFSSFLDFWI